MSKIWPASSQRSAVCGSFVVSGLAADRLEHLGREPCHGGVVVDHEHAQPGKKVLRVAGLGRPILRPVRLGIGKRREDRVTSVPSPGVLRMVTLPAAPSAKPWTWLRPRPVPFPTALVVKKGSKTRASDLRRHAGAGVGDAQRDMSPAQAVAAAP